MFRFDCCRGNTASATCSGGRPAARADAGGAGDGRAAGAGRRRVHSRAGNVAGRQRRSAAWCWSIRSVRRRTSRTRQFPARTAALLGRQPGGHRPQYGMSLRVARAVHRDAKSPASEASRRMFGIVRGVTPAAPLLRRQVQLVEGNWPGPGEVLVGRLVAAKLGCDPRTAGRSARRFASTAAMEDQRPVRRGRRGIRIGDLGAAGGLASGPEAAGPEPRGGRLG